MALEVFDARTDVRNLFITPEIRSRIMRFEPGDVSHGHTHDLGHEMFVVLAGRAEFTIAGESAIVGPAQICVARAGEWHEIRSARMRPLSTQRETGCVAPSRPVTRRGQRARSTTCGPRFASCTQSSRRPSTRGMRSRPRSQLSEVQPARAMVGQTY